MENVLGRTSIEILKCRRRMFAEESGQPSQIQGQDHLFVNVQRHQLVTQQERKRMLSKCNACCFVRQSLQIKTALKTKKSGTETWSNNHLAKWNSTAEIMMQEFAESGHPGVQVLVSVVKRRAQAREVDDLRPFTPQTQFPRKRC